MKTFEEIHKEAIEAAHTATNRYIAEYLGGKDNFPCGFAWVRVIEKASTKTGKAMIKCGFSKSYQKGIQLWNPSGSMFQNVDAKLAGAEAYARVLVNNGFNAIPESRWD